MARRDPGLERSCAPLTVATVHAGDDVAVTRVDCHEPAGPGETTVAGHTALVLVRRGLFTRVADGVTQVLDPTLAYVIRAGEEQRYDHAHGHGDLSTSIRVAPELLDEVPDLPRDPFPTSAAVDLAHRALLATTGSAHEHALALLAAVLPPARTGRPRRSLVDAVREAVHLEPDAALAAVARRVGVSPYHLSRTFTAATGETISRYRGRLRVREAIERLTATSEPLADVAAAAGYADQSHLTRAVTAETGLSPARLRHSLR